VEASAAPGAPSEPAEASAAPRPPRRRRSRGRKPRGASVLAAGAYIDPAAAAHPADEGGDFADDQDEGADEGHPDESGGEMAEDAGAGPDAPDADAMRPQPAEPAEQSLPPAGEGTEPDRPAFSLFSWMRRDPAPRPSTPAEEEPASGPGKRDPLE
jgi:hypothetical protein